MRVHQRRPVADRSDDGLWRTSRERLIRAGKPSWGGLASRALPIALLVAGCSLGSSELSVTPVTVPSRPAAPTIDGGSTSGPETSGGVAFVDGRDRLDDALDATGGEYRYETIVTIGDAVTMQVSGSVSGIIRIATITTGGSVTEYVTTDGGEWISGPTDADMLDHALLAGHPPLEALIGPQWVGPDPGIDDEDDVVLSAVYSGDSVGIPDVATVEVQVTIRDGVVHQVEYEIPAGEATADVVTVISGFGDAAAITGAEPRSTVSAAR